MRALALAIITCLATADGPASAEMATIEIKEWEVPWGNSRPRDPYVAPDGHVWFVGQRSDYMAALDPGTGAFKRVDLDPGTGPHNLIVGEDGTVWYAGNLAAHIGRYSASEGIHKIAMPDNAARDPHTLIFDGKGHVWFTVQGGNFIGRLEIDSEKVELVAVPTPRARPYGIDIAPDGTVWVALFGTDKLASVNAQTLSLREHQLPRSDARPRRLGVAEDGRVWYVDYARGYLGVFVPATGAFTEWPMPARGRSRPYGMAIDGQGRIWAVETGVTPNTFAGFDPVQGEFFSVTPIPSGGGTIRHMDYHKKTGRVWFGTDVGTIGYAQVE